MNDDSFKSYYCYILTNKHRTVLYVGYTDDINRRVQEHLNGEGAVFTKKYNVFYLIYFKEFDNKKVAKSREIQLKNWHKEWKWNLIKTANPNLETLSIT